MKTKFKVGDKVKIRKDLLPGEVYYSKNVSVKFTKEMYKYKGKIGKVIFASKLGFFLDIDHKENIWSHDMLEQGILEKAEKRYLRSVIKPFKNRIAFIELTNENCICNGDVYINIEIDNGIDGIQLPVFKYGTMYKNMKYGRQYTLEELGLD